MLATIRAFESALDVECNDETFERARALAPAPFSVEVAANGAERRPLLPVVASSDPVLAAERLLSDAEHLLALASTRYVVVHAGVVSIGGRLVLLPGRSEAGKTTAVQALIERGATYYSDDYALIDEYGRVAPYPRPLGVRVGSGVERRDARRLGAAVGAEPADASLVIFTDYQRGAVFDPVRLGSGAGVLRLVDHCLQARTAPERVLSRLAAVARSATFLEGPRGEASEFVASLQRLVDGSPAHGQRKDCASRAS